MSMKKYLIISAGLLLSLNNLWADVEKEIKSPVKHATVYPDRAQLTHEAATDLSAGRTLLRFGDLSPYIDPQSIQVKGTGEFTILSVNYQNNYLENLSDIPEIKTLRNQIEALQYKIEDEKAAIKVLNEKEAFLVANRAILVKETTFSIDQVRNMMELYTSGIDQVTMSVLKKNRLIKDYEEQIAVLQKQLADNSVKKQLPSGEISVLVSAGRQVTGKLTVSYVTSNAGWYPSYDIRVDDITKPVSILYKANVHQNTGVVWKDVKLSFSNATPWVAGNVPVLYPWFVDFYNPAPVIMRNRAAAASKADAPIMMEIAADEAKMAREEVAALPVMVEKQVGETTVSFDFALPYTINPDGKIQIIEIQRTSSPAEYRYVTVPKASPLAYLTGNITGWAEQSLQSGEATLYFENTFVGNSYLDVNQLTDTLTISLGTDNSILVKREKRKDFTSRKVIGANKTESYSFLITIRNNKTNPIKITVNDQLPVSSNSNITVEPVELSGGRLNQQTGQVKWDLELNGGESKQLIFTYSVKYPKDKTVILE